MAKLELGLIAAAGALGTLARYGLSGLCQRLTQGSASHFPVGTLMVNVVGCLLVGLLVPILLERAVPTPWRMAIIVGFLGAFTTFSAFSYETLALFRDHNWSLGVANVLLHNLGGLSAALLGLWLAQRYLAA